MAKILVVEDDSLMSRMYQKIFSFEGYEVVLAVDGQDGFEKAKLQKPTIILLDVMMPKMNGIQTLEKLKLDPETKAIPVIMLTNLAGQQDAETALTKGAIKYIIKSEHEPKEVTNMVKEILAGYTRNEVPTTQATTPASPVQAAAPKPKEETETVPNPLLPTPESPPTSPAPKTETQQ